MTYTGLLISTNFTKKTTVKNCASIWLILQVEINPACKYLLADQERYVRALMGDRLQDRNFLATYHSFNFQPLKYEEFTVR